MILGFLYFIYVVNCLVLIFFVLLQQSKGGGLAGAFGGGGGSDTFFGYTSMQKIGHYTIYAAILFIFLAMLISHFPYQQNDGLIKFQDQSGAPVSAPAASAPAAPSEGSAGTTSGANPQPAEGQVPPPQPQ